MKKVLMFLCFVFALFGCEKVTDEEPFISVDPPVPEQEWVSFLVDGELLRLSFKYGMDDPRGFGRHPLIDKLSDSTRVVIKEGLVLEYKPNKGNSNTFGVWILSNLNNREEVEYLMKEINEYGSTISLKVYHDEGDKFDWISGVKNGKGWIGKADSKTRQVINEWTDGIDVEQDIKVDLGYGDYNTIHMDRLSIQTIINMGNESLVATTGYNSKNDMMNKSVWYNLFVLSDSKIVSIPLKHLFLDYPNEKCRIRPWYKNSFLVSQDSQTPQTYTCYSLEGKLIDTFIEYGRLKEGVFPCSYSDYIELGGRIYRTSFNDPQYSIWGTHYEPLSQIPSNSKVTYTLLSSSTDIWEFKADVLNYDGSKKSLKFKVNIKTGEVTD